MSCVPRRPTTATIVCCSRRPYADRLTDDELQGMLDHADKSNLGYVSKDDFYRLMKKKSSAAIDDLLGDD